MNDKKRKKWFTILPIAIVLIASVICLTKAVTPAKSNDNIQKVNTDNTKTQDNNKQNRKTDFILAEAAINGYELRLELLPDKKQSSGDMLNNDMYEGNFAWKSYKDDVLYDTYKIHFTQKEKLYFPKDGITLEVKDYDGDGQKDDFSLGQGQFAISSLSNYMMYEFFTVDEDGSIIQFALSTENGENIVTLPGEYSKAFERKGGEVIYTGFSTAGTPEEQTTSIVRLLSVKDTAKAGNQAKKLLQAVQNTMPQKVIKELNQKGVWHISHNADGISYLLANGTAYDDISLRLDFTYTGNVLTQYVSKGYGFVDDMPKEQINKKQALVLAQKFAKEFLHKDLIGTTEREAHLSKTAADTNLIWQTKTPSKWQGGDYVYFEDSFGATYLVWLSHNMLIEYEALP